MLGGGEETQTGRDAGEGACPRARAACDGGHVVSRTFQRPAASRRLPDTAAAT